MSKKAWIIGGAAAAALLVGGFALAQSGPHGRGGFGPSFGQGEGYSRGGGDGMGHGWNNETRRGERSGMGPGMMGRGMHEGMERRMGQGMGPGMRGNFERGGPRFGFADSAQLDALKRDLGITAAQEAAWTKYAKAVEDAETTRRNNRDNIDRDAVRKMTPEDRNAFRQSMQEQRRTQFDAIKTSADELIATLDDAQKQKARQSLPGLAFGYGGGPGGHGHMAGAKHGWR